MDDRIYTGTPLDSMTSTMRIRGRDPVLVKERFEGRQLFRKKSLVRALQLPNDVEVDTPEGTMRAYRGDYLVSDEEMTHCWPVKKSVFESTYEVAEDA